MKIQHTIVSIFLILFISLTQIKANDNNVTIDYTQLLSSLIDKNVTNQIFTIDTVDTVESLTEYMGDLVLIKGDYIYIGMGHLLYIIDISNIYNPQVIKEVVINYSDEILASEIESLKIYNNELYVYARDGSYRHGLYLNIYDISEPANPTLMGVIFGNHTLEYKTLDKYIYTVTNSISRLCYSEQVDLFKKESELKGIELNQGTFVGESSFDDILKISNDKRYGYLVLNESYDKCSSYCDCNFRNPTLYIIDHQKETDPIIGTFSWDETMAVSLKLDEEKNEISITTEDKKIKIIDITDKNNPIPLDAIDKDVYNVRVENITNGSFDILWDGNPNAKIWLDGLLTHLGTDNRHTLIYYDPIANFDSIKIQGVGGTLEQEIDFNPYDFNSSTPVDINKSDIYDLEIKNISDHSVDVLWKGDADAKTWVYVYEPYSVTGPKHETQNNSYTYSQLASDVNFTVYIESNKSGKILKKEFKTFAKKDVYNLRLKNITDHSVDVSWDGNPNAKTWVYVHEQEVQGPKHSTKDNKYTYCQLGPDIIFTLYVQGEGGKTILKKHFKTSSKNENVTTSTLLVQPDYLNIKEENDFGILKKTSSPDGTKVIYYNGIAIYLYDISNPNEPKLLDSILRDGDSSFYKIKTISFLSNDTFYLNIIRGEWIDNISFNPFYDNDAPTELNSYTIFYDISSNQFEATDGFKRSSFSGDIVKSEDGTKLYYPSLFVGLEIIDISDSSRPMVINTYKPSDTAVSKVIISKDKTKAYLFHHYKNFMDEQDSNIIEIIDISNPSKPKKWEN